VPGEKVSIIHWCEGTGHATRSIPVAERLEEQDRDVKILGGGFGRKFVELNGFEVPEEDELTEIEFVPRLRDDEKNVLTKAKEMLTEVLPATFRRFRDTWSWLRREDPEKVLTDDPIAVLAASLQRKDFYRLDHLRPGLFDGMGRFIYTFYLKTSLVPGQKIFFTSLTDHEDTENTVYVGPLAQEGEGEIEPYDVLLIPGSYGEEFSDIGDRLEEKGLEVRMVGDEDWELVPAMTPYTEAADCVVCTGYSAISDSVVAGTPCVVYPFLSFQEVIADEISSENLPGLKAVKSIESAVEEAENFTEGKGGKPDYKNGADKIVSHLLEEK
jgi:hypothetical protein